MNLGKIIFKGLFIDEEFNNAPYYKGQSPSEVEELNNAPLYDEEDFMDVARQAYDDEVREAGQMAYNEVTTSEEDDNLECDYEEEDHVQYHKDYPQDDCMICLTKK